MNNVGNITSDKCTGCTACVSVCPFDALNMVSDEEGFLVPRVNAAKCTDCGLCEKACQALRNVPVTKDINNKAYAVYYDNDDIRKNSASGAYFQAVADHFIHSGGYVCGCVLENMKVKHIVSNDTDDVRRMADSKYVQSDMNDCFVRIKKLLDAGKPVLFSGTSCQVAGLRSYLDITHTDTDKLLCVDSFCHGVPSPLIWDEYIKYFETKRHKQAVGYKWRCKEHGWGVTARGLGYLGTMMYRSGNSVKKDRFLIAKSWRQIFFSDLVLRRKCHSCDHCTVDKPGDITMSDFWGIENVLPEFYDSKGTSLVIVHNADDLKYVTDIEGLKYESVDVSESIKRQMNAFEPSAANDRREEFWNDYRSNGFNYVLRKYFIPIKRYFKEPIKQILFLL